MNKKFLFKCVVALSAITPAAIVSIVEEPVVVQAQTQEQTGEFISVDALYASQTRHSGYTNGGVFCNREIHSFATKSTQCCRPIVSI